MSAVGTLRIQSWNDSVIAPSQRRVCIIRLLPTTHLWCNTTAKKTSTILSVYVSQLCISVNVYSFFPPFARSTSAGLRTRVCSPTRRTSRSALSFWVTSRGPVPRRPTGSGHSSATVTVSVPRFFQLNVAREMNKRPILFSQRTSGTQPFSTRRRRISTSPPFTESWAPTSPSCSRPPPLPASSWKTWASKTSSASSWAVKKFSTTFIRFSVFTFSANLHPGATLPRVFILLSYFFLHFVFNLKFYEASETFKTWPVINFSPWCNSNWAIFYIMKVITILVLFGLRAPQKCSWCTFMTCHMLLSSKGRKSRESPSTFLVRKVAIKYRRLASRGGSFPLACLARLLRYILSVSWDLNELTQRNTLTLTASVSSGEITHAALFQLGTLTLR